MYLQHSNGSENNKFYEKSYIWLYYLIQHAKIILVVYQNVDKWARLF